MTAEALGARLLREVNEESLDELLQTLRIEASQFISTSKPLPFDFFVGSRNSATHSDPTRNQHHRSTPSDASAEPTRLPADPSTTKSPTVNLTSSRPGSGKTQLLYYILALTILPQVYHTNSNVLVKLPGRNCLAIIYDTDARFSAIRLQQVLQHVLSTQAKSLPATQSLNAEDIDGIVNQSLRHLYIFQPNATAQLLANLTSLSQYLLQLQPPASLHPLGALILDSMSSFYWPDRLTQDLSRLPPDQAQTPREVPTNCVPQILTCLRSIQSTFSCPIIYTTRQGLNPFSANFATLTLNIERVPVPRFPPFMSVEEAGGREKELRWREVVKGRFSAKLVGNSIVSRVSNAKEGNEGSSWLGFKIISEGVETETDSAKDE